MSKDTSRTLRNPKLRRASERGETKALRGASGEKAIEERRLMDIRERKGRKGKESGHPPTPTNKHASLPWPTPAHNTGCAMREVSTEVRLR